MAVVGRMWCRPCCRLNVQCCTQVSVPFESFYKTFKHPGSVSGTCAPSHSDDHAGHEEDAVVTTPAAPAQCPESVNAYLGLCQKYGTEANAGYPYVFAHERADTHET